MNAKDLYYNTLFSLFVFIILISKDILVSCLHLIPERSPTNRLISWVVILPLSIVGIILSIRVIRYYLRHWLDKRTIPIDLTLLLLLPFLLYILYYGVLFIIGFYAFVSCNIK